MTGKAQLRSTNNTLSPLLQDHILHRLLHWWPTRSKCPKFQNSAEFGNELSRRQRLAQSPLPLLGFGPGDWRKKPVNTVRTIFHIWPPAVRSALVKRVGLGRNLLLMVLAKLLWIQIPHQRERGQQDTEQHRSPACFGNGPSCCTFSGDALGWAALL